MFYKHIKPFEGKEEKQSNERQAKRKGKAMEMVMGFTLLAMGSTWWVLGWYKSGVVWSATAYSTRAVVAP